MTLYIFYIALYIFILHFNCDLDDFYIYNSFTICVLLILYIVFLYQEMSNAQINKTAIKNRSKVNVLSENNVMRE